MRKVVGTRHHTVVKDTAACSERRRNSEEDGGFVASCGCGCGCGCFAAISRAIKVHRTGFANRDTTCSKETSGVSMLEAERSAKQANRTSRVSSRMEGNAGPPIRIAATQYWMCISKNALKIFQHGSVHVADGQPDTHHSAVAECELEPPLRQRRCCRFADKPMIPGIMQRSIMGEYSLLHFRADEQAKHFM